MSDNENPIEVVEEGLSPEELKEIFSKALKYDGLKTKYFKMMNKLENVSEQRKATGNRLKDLAIHVVGSKAGKDVGRVGWGSSLKATKEQFTAHPKKYNGWQVMAEDVDGDHIPEIVIRDAENIERYINGYSIKPSKHTQREDYYSAFPTQTQRTLTPKSKYFRGTEIDEEGNMTFSHPEAYRPMTKTGKKQLPKLKTLFNEFIIKRFIKAFKINNQGIIDQIPKNIRGEIALLFNKIAWFDVRKILYNSNGLGAEIRADFPTKDLQKMLTGAEKNETFRKTFSAMITPYMKQPDFLGEQMVSGLSKRYNEAIDIIHNKYGVPAPL